MNLTARRGSDFERLSATSARVGPSFLARLYMPRETRTGDSSFESRKNEVISIGGQPKKGNAVQKIQASSGVVVLLPALTLFACMEHMWHSANHNSN
jgi:hypothetical protein